MQVAIDLGDRSYQIHVVSSGLTTLYQHSALP